MAISTTTPDTQSSLQKLRRQRLWPNGNGGIVPPSVKNSQPSNSATWPPPNGNTGITGIPPGSPAGTKPPWVKTPTPPRQRVSPGVPSSWMDKGIYNQVDGKPWPPPKASQPKPILGVPDTNNMVDLSFVYGSQPDSVNSSVRRAIMKDASMVRMTSSDYEEQHRNERDSLAFTIAQLKAQDRKRRARVPNPEISYYEGRLQRLTRRGF